MNKRDIKLLKKIVETPSPTGSEMLVAEFVRNRLDDVADEIFTDTMGSVHATYRAGEPSALAQPMRRRGLRRRDWHRASQEEQKQPTTLMLSAHMDEIGLMVTYISDEGFLSVAAVGGVDAAVLPGMRVDVHTAGGTLRGVVGRKPIHLIDPDDRKTVTPIDSLVIDLGLPAKTVKKKVRVGDQITFGVGFERFGKDMAVSRAFDDKVGVFIACRVMENLADEASYGGEFVAAITVQEEIGTRGAMTSAHAIAPDVALAFDVTHATDYPGIEKAKYGDICCGGGPVIARGPNINPVVFERLVAAARAEGIPFQLEAEPSVTGTDARAIQVTRGGIPTGLVSIPLRYMHTPTEVISLSDVEATVALITRFALDLDSPEAEQEDFVPSKEHFAGDGGRAVGTLMAKWHATDNAEDTLDDDFSDVDDETEYTPESAPFGRQQKTISAGFKGTKAQSVAEHADTDDADKSENPDEGAAAESTDGEADSGIADGAQPAPSEDAGQDESSAQSQAQVQAVPEAPAAHAVAAVAEGAQSSPAAQQNAQVMGYAYPNYAYQGVAAQVVPGVQMPYQGIQGAQVQAAQAQAARMQAANAAGQAVVPQQAPVQQMQGAQVAPAAGVQGASPMSALQNAQAIQEQGAQAQQQILAQKKAQVQHQAKGASDAFVPVVSLDVAEMDLDED